MKALVLSGGEGVRVSSITHTGAKQLLPVANKPVLFYGIDAITKAGIKDIGIVVGRTHRDVRREVGSGKRWGTQVRYIVQQDPMGLAHAVMISRDFLKEDPFVLYLGDNILKQEIRPIIKEFCDSSAHCWIMLARVNEPQRYGVAEIQENKVVRVVEKPHNPPSDLAIVGVYIFDRHVFGAIDNIRPSSRNELEITDAIQYLIDRGYDVRCTVLQDEWKDIGDAEDLLGANRMMLGEIEMAVKGEVNETSRISGTVDIRTGVRISQSIINGPVSIATGCVVTRSLVGALTSISRDTVIEGVTIQRSVILDNCEIIGSGRLRITDSVIGSGVRIITSDSREGYCCFRLGSGAHVEIH